MSSNRINAQILIGTILVILPFAAAYPITYDVNTMAESLRQNAQPIVQLVVAISYVIGFFYTFSAISDMRTLGRGPMMMAQGMGFAKPLIKFSIGIALIYLPSVINVSIYSIWGHPGIGQEAQSIMEYKPDMGDPWGSIKAAALDMVMIIGYVVFIRGFVTLNKLSLQGSQPGTAGRGFTLIVGGILAINIWQTIQLIENTFGISILS